VAAAKHHPRISGLPVVGGLKKLSVVWWPSRCQCYKMCTSSSLTIGQHLTPNPG